MNEFQLYKKRDFSSYISDTLSFFRVYWKDFFLNFLKIFGGILIILGAIYFLFFKEISFTSFITEDFNYNFNANPAYFITLTLVICLFSAIFSVLCFLYPIEYLKIIASGEKSPFSHKLLFSEIKKDIWRAIRFTLISCVVLTPIVILIFGLTILLIFIVIGIFLLIILLPAILVIYIQAFYLYVNEGMGFFQSLSKAISILFGQFIPILGSTLITYYIYSTVTGLFYAIPLFINMFYMINTGGELSSAMITTTAIFNVVYIVIHYIIFNFFLIGQGLIYYSYQEKTTHVSAYSEIESIGQNE